MDWPGLLPFASDATLVALAGVALLLLAGIATCAEWRRSRRQELDAVGCMPWTALFVACAVGGIALLTAALHARGAP